MENTASLPNFQATALNWARAGFPVFPCAPGGKVPLIKGGKGYLDATTDEQQIRAWWSANKTANIAINCAAAGLVVLDHDPYKEGCEFDQFMTGKTMPQTFVVRTPRGGHHYYFTAREGASYPGELCKGVDLKHRGYVLIPPSVVNGAAYQEVMAHKIAAAPDWMEKPAGNVIRPKPESWIRDAQIAHVTEETMREIESAVAGLSDERATARDDWKKAGMALACFKGTQFEQRAFAAFYQFSQRTTADNKSSDDELAQEWQSFEPNAITYQSIFKWAQDDGWINPRSKAAVPVPTAGGGALMNAESQLEHFKGCVYIIDRHAVLLPNGDIVKPEAFSALMGGYDFEYAQGGRNATTRKAFDAFTQNQFCQFPKVNNTCFRPGLAFGATIEENGRHLVNTYRPPVVSVSDDDPSPWLNLLAVLLPDERDRAILISYLAAMIQYPGVKFRWAPLIQGVAGNGKTAAIIGVAQYLVGEKYSHKPNAQDLGGNGLKFTGWLHEKLFIGIEEIYVHHRREVIDGLKPLITDDRIQIQRKGQDQFAAVNCANFILTSNYKEAIPKTADDRRYAIFITAQQSADDLKRDGLTDQYFYDLHGWLRAGGLAAVAGYLKRYAIPDDLNPAGACVRAPHTSTTDEAIAASLGLVEQFIMEAVSEERPGFRGGWLSSVKINQLMSEKKKTITPNRMREIIKTLGYVSHPALSNNGKSPRVIPLENNSRPRLYVRSNSDLLEITDPAIITQNYCTAQGYVMAEAGLSGPNVRP